MHSLFSRFDTATKAPASAMGDERCKASGRGKQYRIFMSNVSIILMVAL